MAWVKIPKEHHPLFLACLPQDPRISTLNMFGGVGAKVNGQMFAGLFGRGAIVKLSPADKQAALALDGAALFDPMGNGRVVSDKVQLPESVMDEPDELRSWILKAFSHAATLPAKAELAASKPRRGALAAHPTGQASAKPLPKKLEKVLEKKLAARASKPPAKTAPAVVKKAAPKKPANTKRIARRPA